MNHPASIRYNDAYETIPARRDAVINWKVLFKEETAVPLLSVMLEKNHQAELPR